MTPIVISEGAVEPIGLEEAAGNVRAQDDGNSPPTFYEAPLILRLIKAARQVCEQELEQSLIEKTLEVEQDYFSVLLELPGGPVRSIVSVSYLDMAGADTVVDPALYRLARRANMAIVRPVYGHAWPAARVDTGSVRVRYTVGFSAENSPPEEVPEPIRQAMHLYIAHYFKNREAVDSGSLGELPLGARYLLTPYRAGLGV